MKVYNDIVVELNENLGIELERLRSERAFDLDSWLENKTELINQYFQSNNLSGAVVGVSGGLDSAVVLALLSRASKIEGSTINTIIPLLLPAMNSAGASKQDASVERALELCEFLNLKPSVFKELTALSNIVTPELERILGVIGTDWSLGQLIPYLRTPLLYNTCSILTANGTASIVVGTTNFSEGGYLGYVGKASDGMTDLQVISDLFKSEVFAVAEELGVPKSILETTPTGDMFDSRVDEEVFGATYDFVELFMLGKQYGLRENVLSDRVYKNGAKNLEKLHSYNAHKYLYSYPSVFIDLLPTQIPGGWNNPRWRME